MLKNNHDLTDPDSNIINIFSIYSIQSPQWVRFTSAKRRGDLCLLDSIINQCISLMLEPIIQMMDVSNSFVPGACQAHNRTKVLLCPIPYRSQNILQRGFSPQHLIVDRLVSSLNLYILKNTKRWTVKADFHRLERARETRPQTGLGRRERLRAQEASFRVNSDTDHSTQEKLIIIDDVVTTKSTMLEAIQTLRESSMDVLGGVTLFGDARF